MRIALFTPEYEGFGGGIMTFYRHLVPALMALGHDLRVIVGSQWVMGETDERRTIPGLTVEMLNVRRYRQALDDLPQVAAAPLFRQQLAASLALFRQYENGPECDVVEATDFGLLSLGPCLFKGPPVLTQMHGSVGQIALKDPQPGRGVDDALSLAVETELVRACAIVCSTVGNRTYWEAQGARSARVSEPAWVPHEKVAPGPISDRMVVLGRIQRWKGPDVLCRALRLLGAGGISADWYGRDTDCGTMLRSTNARLAREYPDIWGSRVVPKPQVSQSEVETIQARSRLNLIPSSWDVFNFTVVEALASGRPVVCSNGAGAAELIEDGVSGILFERDNPDALADAIERALALSGSEERAMAEAARHTISKRLSPTGAAERRTELYRKVAANADNESIVLPEWVREICRPSARRIERPLEHLNLFPTQDLIRYVGTRVVKRMRRLG